MRKVEPLARMFVANPQCVIGAALGAAAVFLPWMYVEHIAFHFPAASFWEYYHPTFEGHTLNLLQSAVLISGPLKAFSMLFAIGVALSFLSPLGGIVQGSGLAGFAYVYAASHGEFEIAVYEVERSSSLIGYPEVVYSSGSFVLALGFAVAAISTLMVLSSASSAVREVREGPAVHNRVAALAWNTSRTR